MWKDLYWQKAEQHQKAHRRQKKMLKKSAKQKQEKT